MADELMMMMTTTVMILRYPRCGTVELFSVASGMYLLYSNDYQYLLSVEIRHTSERPCILPLLLLVLSVLDSPLHGIVHIIDNDRGFVCRFTSSVHTSAKQDGRPLASESALVRVSTSDIRFCSMVSNCL